MGDLEDLKLFQKAYDCYEWLYPHLKNFPKSERFTMVQHIENSLLDFLATIVMARKADDTLAHLHAADTELEKLKIYLRLSRDLEFVSIGQYEESSERLTELGKMLGGWIEAEKGSTTTQAKLG